MHILGDFVFINLNGYKFENFFGDNYCRPVHTHTHCVPPLIIAIRRIWDTGRSASSSIIIIIQVIVITIIMIMMIMWCARSP